MKNREQRRHPEGVKVPSPEDTSMKSTDRLRDDYSVPAKSSGHKKKTADKWNQ